MTKRDTVRFLLVLFLCLPVCVLAQEETPPDPDEILANSLWPRKIEKGDTTFSIHQPQVEEWDGSVVQARAAFSVTKGEESPRYGVVLLSAATHVDKNARLVTLDNIDVISVEFPSDEEREETFLEGLRRLVVEKSRVIPLDNFEAALAILEAEKQAKTFPLRNDPPRIIFSDVPAIPIYVDGDPAYRVFETSRMERVINTNVLLVRFQSSKHFLKLFDGWMESAKLTGSWTVATSPPKDLEKIEEWARESERVDLMEGSPDPEEPDKKPSLSQGPVPIIHVATEPTELIVTDGEPQFEAIEGTQLLYASNTTGHLFKHSGEDSLYVLISGRWFRAPATNGPWTFIKGGQLPADFTNIPDDSPKENVKASVPGTVQAQEAVIAAGIPQTADVRIGEARMIPPLFDGDPQLKPIEGTSLQYVANTPTPMIFTDGHYYAVDNGIWFTSSATDGPWAVARSVPAEIYSIPPSSPLHYITYVRVYAADEETVRVGYTPGYSGTMVTTGSGAIVVYGTGYHYHPWVGSYWYGPPVTYGSGVSITYTPWTGWCFGFGFGWYWGPSYATVGWGWGPSPWWGPVGWGWYYPPPYYARYGYAWGPYGGRAAWGPGGWAATTGNVYHRWGDTGAVTRRSGGYNAWTGNRWANQVGMSYNSRNGNLAAGQRAAVGNVYTGNYAYGRRGAVVNTDTGLAARGGTATIGNARTGNSATVGRAQITNPNTGRSGSVGAIRTDQGGAVRVGDSVFAGKDGQVYRRGDSGWEQVNRNGSWNKVQNQNRNQSLNRQYNSRSTGNQRYQNYRSGSYRTMQSRPRGGGRRRF
ncbi:MAG: autotransporter [Acidobacteriota bacterium]|nr:MAG: autotransporter [Acidobacteriota bacterium]